MPKTYIILNLDNSLIKKIFERRSYSNKRITVIGLTVYAILSEFKNRKRDRKIEELGNQIKELQRMKGD